MAPLHSSGLSKFVFAVSRFRNKALKPVVPGLQDRFLLSKPYVPWQFALHRCLSADNDGGNDEGEGGKPFKRSVGSFADRNRESSSKDEFRLFGEGGLFGKPASSRGEREMDELDDQDFQDEQKIEFVEDEHEAQSWDTESFGPRITMEEYTPGGEVESEEGWAAEDNVEGLSSEGAPEILAAEGSSDTGTLYPEWMAPGEKEELKDDLEEEEEEEEEDEGPSYIGEWGPDGTLIKGQPRIAVEGSQDPGFGDLIRRKGYTDDDIANLLAGFYEPAGLPHLDDYKDFDVDAVLKARRRERELQKIAEMAKRWVKKIDDQGFSHGVGRRKTSSARVWIKEGQGRIVINKKHHDMYFFSMDDRMKYLEPFVLTDTLGMFDTFVLVRGGGTTGQAGAVRLGVSRALMWYEPSLRHTLKKAGMLTRDPRMVERKKPGKAKARRSFQWVKR